MFDVRWLYLILDNLILFPPFVISGQKTKPHVPCMGKWGLEFFLYRGFVFNPPGSQRGLRAKRHWIDLTRMCNTGQEIKTNKIESESIELKLQN